MQDSGRGAICRVIAVLGALAWLAPAAASAAAERSDPPEVHTDNGVLRGARGPGVLEFKGIPFAAPPLGVLRFAPPRPADPWPGVRDATAYRSPCPQVERYGQTDASDDEDCLYLNVTVPTDAAAASAGHAPKPVIVWIHGGAYVGGSADIYPLDYFARLGDVILVSINYRLGVFGFLAHPAFDRAHDGSLGLEDQRAALRWVRRNIGAFGGDPGNVTVAGESAGAASVCMQLIAPGEAAGLFAKAIVQSLGCTIELRAMDAADATGTELAALVGCGDRATAVTCLRGKSVRELLDAQVTVGGSNVRAFAPPVGSISVPRQGREAFATGQFVRVPLLNGGNREEMGLYVTYEVRAGARYTRGNYLERLRTLYGDHAADVARRYPPPDDAAVAGALGRLESDFMPGSPLTNCLFLETARHAARYVAVYQYEFADPDAPSVLPKPAPEKGPVHSAELAYFFPHVSFNRFIDGPDLAPGSQPLSRQMVAYWSEFARSGRPSPPGQPAWPRYRTSRDVLRLEPGRVGTFDAARAHQCRFWRTLYPATLG